MEIGVAVCDDNVDILSILTAAIESAFSKQCNNFYIDSYSSVEKLNKQIEKKMYHISFLDIDKPKMDGISFAEQLRERNNNACII